MNVGLKLLLGLGVGALVIYGVSQSMAAKKKQELISMIMQLGAFMPAFDASPQILATLSNQELETLFLQMQSEMTAGHYPQQDAADYYGTPPPPPPPVPYIEDVPIPFIEQVPVGYYPQP